MKTVTVELHETTYAELEILTQEIQAHGSPWVPINSVEELVHHVLATVTEGSCRPGSWERQLLYPMGLVPRDSELLDYDRIAGSREIPEQPPIWPTE